VSTHASRAPLGTPTNVGARVAALAVCTAVLAAGSAVSVGPAAIAIPLALVAAIVLVRERIALLTLFIFIGLFKGEAALKAAPVDLTLVLGGLLCVVCFFRWVQGKARAVPFLLAITIAVIGLALLVSLDWTTAPGYGGEKAQKFVTITLLAILAPYFLFDDRRDLRRFLWWTIALAFVASLLALANGPSHYDRLTITGEGNTIGVSHLLCTAALILVLGALTDLVAPRWLAVLGSAALIGVAAAVGSRGPILSLGLALVVTGAVWLLRVPRKAAPVLLVIAAGVALSPLVPLPRQSAQRLGQAARDPVGALRTDPRHVIFGQAVDVIKQHPIIGIGAGAFQPIGRLAHPPEDYPHNIFLEVWAELGILPVALLAGCIIAVLLGLFRRAWLMPNGPPSALFYMLIGIFLFNLFSAQLTGDLNDNRTFWNALGLSWLLVAHGLPADPEEGDLEADGSAA
jgi:O-antigen ligase